MFKPFRLFELLSSELTQLDLDSRFDENNLEDNMTDDMTKEDQPVTH